MPERRKARAMRSAPRPRASPPAVTPRLAVALLAFYQLLTGRSRLEFRDRHAAKLRAAERLLRHS